MPARLVVSRHGWSLAVTALCFAGTASAQQSLHATASRNFAVTGTVVDDGGNLVTGAEVAVIDRDAASRLAHSDDRGRFRFDSLARDTATIRVRHVGFQAKTLGVKIVDERAATMFVQLERVRPTSIAPVNIDEAAPDHGSDQLAEFYGRERTNHMGHFLDEAKLEELHPEHTSDALRAVPGVLVRPARRIGNTVRIRGCAPLIWVDGLRAAGAELDDVTRGPDVAAIEVYTSMAGVPAQYTDRSATCGTILVWLKVR
jgi:hypothetical protein